MNDRHRADLAALDFHCRQLLNAASRGQAHYPQPEISATVEVVLTLSNQAFARSREQARNGSASR